MAGIFITIEGMDGTGKTTLAAALAERLRAGGREVVLTSEPGGGPVGESIRKILLDPANSITDRAELLLFEAARAQHVETLIRPALERGAAVICDRYTDSSTAYQGAARGLGIDAVRRLNDFATGGLKPDLTILLDLPADRGLARQSKVDRVSSESMEFHKAVRQGFLDAAQAEPERFAVIDAAMPFELVVEEAAKALSRRGIG